MKRHWLARGYLLEGWRMSEQEKQQKIKGEYYFWSNSSFKIEHPRDGRSGMLSEEWRTKKKKKEGRLLEGKTPEDQS